MEKRNEALIKKRLARKRVLDARMIGLKNQRIQKMNVDNVLLKWTLISNGQSSGIFKIKLIFIFTTFFLKNKTKLLKMK